MKVSKYFNLILVSLFSIFTFGSIYSQIEKEVISSIELRNLGPAFMTGRISDIAKDPTNPSTWYLVDPAGWIMMSYNSEVSYKDVISDLKLLLKNSGG